MYCKNCGNALNEDDKFCNNCGFKIEKDFQKNPPQLVNSNHLKTVKKIFIATVLLILIPTLLYSISLPENISIIEFITDPRGLTAVIARKCLQTK